MFMCNFEKFNPEKDFISEEVEFFPRQYKGRNRKYEASRKNKIKDKKKLFSNWIETEFWETKNRSKQVESSVLSKKKISQLNEKLFFYGKPVNTIAYCKGVYIGPKIEKITKPLYDFYSYKQMAKFRREKKIKQLLSEDWKEDLYYLDCDFEDEDLNELNEDILTSIEAMELKFCEDLCDWRDDPYYWNWIYEEDEDIYYPNEDPDYWN